MRFSEYLESCNETWGIGNDAERIEIGIEEEFGELSGKYKRLFRGDYDNLTNFRQDVIAESGDCLYYLIKAIDCFGKIDTDFEIKDIDVESVKPIIAWRGLIGCKYLYIPEKKYIDMLWVLICFVNSQGIKIKEVIDYNIKKLKDRQKRGVIKGHGDLR